MRSHIVLYRSAEWAQKQAQALWDRAALAGKLPAVKETRFLRADRYCEQAYSRKYDLIYHWIPFALYHDTGRCERMVAAVSTALVHGGLAFVVGPTNMSTLFGHQALHLVDAAGVKDLTHLPLLTQHLRLHPRTRLKSSLTVFLVEKLTPGEW